MIFAILSYYMHICQTDLRCFLKSISHAEKALSIYVKSTLIAPQFAHFRAEIVIALCDKVLAVYNLDC